MRHLTRIAGFAVVLMLTASTVQAQKGEGFGVGYTDVGPVIGLGGIGDAGVSFGGRFERGLKALPNLGNGVLSVAVGIDYYRYSSDFPGYSWSFTYVPVGVTANYHFRLDNRKWDPFVGVGLGNYFSSCSTDVSSFGCGAFSSGIYFIGRAGVRYFWNPKMALYADAGSGAGTLHVGLMFNLTSGR